MDGLTTIVATLVGAGLGLAGDWTGRLSARREAGRNRQLILKDAELNAARAESARRKIEIHRRAREAADHIIRAFVENPITITQIPIADARHALRSIVLTVAWESSYIPDSELRRRLMDVGTALDLASAGDAFEGGVVFELLREARSGCRAWLGAWLRDEELPGVSAGWEHMRAQIPQGRAAFEKRLRTSQAAEVSSQSDGPNSGS